MIQYVVRRAFRNFGVVLTPGSFVEPGNVKRFKYRLQERYIVAITEDNFDTWKAYFKDKFGVDIMLPAEAVAPVVTTAKPAEVATPAKTTKPVVKAVVK